jgi:hypothetical protein
MKFLKRVYGWFVAMSESLHEAKEMQRKSKRIP